jgi:beta-lactamase class A
MRKAALLAVALWLVGTSAAIAADGGRGGGSAVRIVPLIPHLPTREDPRLAGALARLGSSFHGWAGIYVEDLGTGTYAGWNENASFPAASTVKLGVIAEGIRRFGFGPGSRIDGDLRAIGQWSSNEATNRVFALIGGVGPTEEALRRLGMFSSTYPGPYLLDDDEKPLHKPRKGVRSPAAVPSPSPPPRSHTRVTTARDLARALFRLQAAAGGQRWAIRATELSAPAARAALGYLALAGPGTSLLTFPAGTRHAEKDGWLDDTRATAAIAYLRRGARIVVVLLYRPGVGEAEARELGSSVSKLAFEH